MRIRSVEAIPLRYDVPEPYGSARGTSAARVTCLVRLESNEGLTGVGEAFGPPLVVAAHVRELAPLFLDRDPFDREVMWAEAVNGRYHWGRTGPHVGALSGIETACWDLMGRATGLPAAKLLGGWSRDAVAVYGSTGYFMEAPDGFQRQVEGAVEEGFRRVKIKCGAGLDVDLARIALAFEIGGAGLELLVDLNGNYTADLALRLCRELEGRRVGWLEEPVPPEDLDGYARVRDGTSVPLAGGEAESLRVGFRELISRRLVDVVQPDVTSCGGLGEARAIVQLAQTWNVRFSPHVWGGGVSLAAALQLCAAVPAYPHAPALDREASPILLEYDRGPNALRDELLSEPLAVDGERIAVPRGPGLGVTVDWEAVERYRIDRT
ncbi:MAG TPA: mandelate racemase/muconate lactonizing enzyme family protein [Thermomicrobiaceae bacterium]|nr:mandelate racemase/muconate lactonizing enzyme family protein [Thermomicrobiaceae bacterium]